VQSDTAAPERPGDEDRPDAPPVPAAIAETHSSVVVFLGDRAYKVKKRVDLGFLDYRTRRAREEACHREVALNRRLAPDVYLGVADVIGTGGQPCDHLIVMRRMPAERRLATLVRNGEDVDDHLWHLAHLLAAFHARAERGAAADAAAGRDALAGRWEHNTAEMLALPGSCLDPGAVRAVDRRAQRYLAGRERLFRARVAQGRACDGHGDLLAEDIFLLDDGPRVLDCIEFDTRLRLDDTLADVAFLAMDLERLGRPDLAERFLDAYREHADDNWPASLAHHHVAYRAQVRAKVAAIRATQGGEGAEIEARELLALAHRHLEAGAVRLVVVGGSPGTGKTTLAAALADALGATAVHSDEIRKELSGLRPDESGAAGFGQGIYRPEATAETYREMLRRAQVALAHGESVVLDASFTAGDGRRRARAIAVATASDLVELRCTAPPVVAAARVRQRLAAGGDASDATPAIAAARAAAADPWPEASAVDTTGDHRRTLRDALAIVRDCGKGLPA
jgi:aminoglycoside phosphotransferase family enzyme/predicted kinase